MIAVVPQVLIDIGTICGALATMLGLAILLSRLRAPRWVWTQLVADPFGEWMARRIRRDVEAATIELRSNGGDSLKDQVTRLDERSCRQEERSTRQEARTVEIESRTARIEGRLVAGDDRMHRIDRRLDEHHDLLIDTHPDHPSQETP